MIGLVMLSSCKKKSDPSLTDPSVRPVTNTNQKTPPTIYILGNEYSGPNTGLTSTIKCWKNGTSLNLGSHTGAGNAITISGEDIYLACNLENAGNTFGTFTSSAGYLKNDRATYLSEPTSRAFGIAVSNNDVYVCGYDRRKGAAAYWKNGTITKLNTYNSNDPNNTNARAIAVVGSDVYVAGYETNGTYTVAKYWKNGKAINLSNGNNDAYATAITIVGNDVYVAGYEKSGLTLIAKYWKNGTLANLSNGNFNTTASAITVVGTDIYVAGTENTTTTETAMYWKNGKSVSLGKGIANAIAVDGSDVYVAGSTGNTAAIWKNGTAETFSLGNGASSAQANAIAVIPGK